MSLLLIILCPFGFALAAMFFPKRVLWQKTCLALGALGTLVFSGLTALEVHEYGIQVLQMGQWEAPIGISFVADRLGALMCTVTGLVAFCVGLYAWRDIEDRLFERQFTALMLFLVTGAQGAYLTGDLFNLYVWFEVLLVSSFVLMVMGSKKHQLQGAVKYLVVNLFSSCLFLIGAGLFYGKLGTLNMADIANTLSQSPDADLISTSGVLLFVAFGIKAALFPLCFWLPASYHTPPATVTALFGGIMTKVGLYAIFRAMVLIVAPAADEFQPVFMAVAMATMLVGVLGAVGQYNVKMILSIHIISQVGYIFAGFTLLSVAGVAAAMLYMVHNIIVKTNLFLIAGVARRINGSDHLQRMGGLAKIHPVLAGTFFVSAFSLAGLPPLSGFWAKFGILSAAIEGQHTWIAIFVVVVSFFTLLSMIKIWLGAFWQPLPENDGADESVVSADSFTTWEERLAPEQGPLVLWLPCLIMGAVSLALGFFGSPLFDYAHLAAVEVLDPQKYIEAVLGGR